MKHDEDDTTRAHVERAWNKLAPRETKTDPTRTGQKKAASEPGIQVPSLNPRRPHPNDKRRESVPARAPGIGRASMHDGIDADEKAQDVAQVLHAHGLHADHPRAEDHIRRWGADKARVRAHIERLKAGKR